VSERATLVAEQRGRVVAAAHLLRYGAGEEVGQAYRGSAEVNWLLFWPRANHWLDSEEAAAALMDACLGRLGSWGGHWHADGVLPAPGVYGMPAQWPHVRELYQRAGFVHDGHVEVVLLARVDELPGPSAPPLEGLALKRSVGESGTRLLARLGEEVVGFVEVDANLVEGGRLAHLGGWADVGNLHVVEAYRRRGVGTWLVGQAADWLRLARVDRLLAYAWPKEQDQLGLLGRVGFRELTRTARGWHHRSGPGASPEAEATPGPPAPAGT
jgi:GNAT superfamily N-acetyltransferase